MTPNDYLGIFFEKPHGQDPSSKAHLFSLTIQGAACNRAWRPKRTSYHRNRRRTPPARSCQRCIAAWRAGWGLPKEALA